ncbi:MAG: cbb3-type cytochrome c oxidase subunit I [Deltaproteobacteria bacterium]|nr:cbb3-type cytochrome c oxidase subunit I [Deltaproteobacteria bacterium]MBW1993190.1 cbb3-type cytochrome c oxidase subunit I [Deltaproteobacteria bacterium]MBW2151808.1 cbb3-type cytochrome c oxidase subunit I [Deltaproteobacteria bacterium]
MSAQNYQSAKGFCVTAAFWLVVATLAGMILATEFVAPDLLGNLSWLSFGRVRPIHTNLVLLGFVFPGLLAAACYFLPGLLQTQLYSERLGLISVWLWNIILACAVVTLAMGKTQAREYAELIWPIDLLVVIFFVLVFYNFAMTVKQRKEPVLYVSVWYVLAAITLTAIVYIVGNVMWAPTTGAMTGMPDAITLWFYGHNILGTLLTPMAVAAAYYIIPRVCRSPLYSHTLSLIGFWGLVLLYTHIGTHHLLQTPAPTWLKVISIVDSIGMIIPVTVVLINLWYTTKGKLGEIHADVAAKFVFAGTIIYLLVCIQGPLHSLPQVQRVTHYTNWVVGHAHLAALGFSGMIAIGGIYHILPHITGRPLYSRFLADLQYWLILLGVSGFTISLSIAGLIQGNGWLNAETVYRILPQLHIYNVIRASTGVMILSGALVGFYNITRSLFLNRQDLSANE